ncbi:HNH endonuclease signature motif containing protein [Burkholderia glumae]|uniref:HNH endonuclease signature motif containing protein n=1 Tax=Burkholderia glumae TaxID=337 RepID=UPI00068743CA|nr:HNH endonuclease signature motif containing protein [Burkholderia glumae]QHP90599.1 HNH endonuclease [Burkholderia glumae]QKM52174.1 hypothetical protein CG017_00163 [Burkholderia glumae]RQZ63927.1 HNH endonuclease [Burkholderia glumae]UVT04598.1 HNH endonuclease [Burkholderia glumae]
MNARDRFMGKVQPVPICGCWIWDGYVDSKMGYGMFWMDGAMRLAHRAAYELFFGAAPGDLHVLHRCDIPSCVNPDHLWLGTNDDNVRDKVQKGRAARVRGVEHHAAKLNDDVVRFIRASSQSSRSLARSLNVCRSTIQYVRKGRLWGHVQ